MILNFHNKIEVIKHGKKYCFYNTMLKSLRKQLKNLDKYFEYLSFGTGEDEGYLANFKLNNFESAIKLETEFLQNNPTSNLYIKKSCVISDDSLDGKYITEAGISAEINENPTIYNYFSLKNADFENGILKEPGEEIAISVVIYLTIENTTDCLLTAGNNPFISFLLGNGLDKNSVFASLGKNLSDNILINREKFNPKQKFLCEFGFDENSDELSLEFSFNINTDDEFYEVVLFAGDKPFARINTTNIKSAVPGSTIVQSTAHNTLNLGKNIKSVSEIKNNQSGEIETQTFPLRFADSFGDKISLPFNNRFNSITPRFLSKEGNKIFFVEDDIVYGYENKDYEVSSLKIQSIRFQNIFKVVAFEDFLFVITKSAPYVHCLYKSTDVYENFKIDLADVAKSDLIEKIYDADVTMGRNSEIMLGMLDSENRFAYTLYFSTNIGSKTITLEEVKTTNYDFDYHYVLCMYKNNFCDSMVIFLRNGPTSVSARIAYFYPDKTLRDISSTLALDLLEHAREVYVKDRAIVVENTTYPSMWLYFYPEIEQFKLSVFNMERDNYISTNLLYLIQKLYKDTYRIFSLANIDEPSSFADDFPEEIDQNKILDFEFLNDTLLIFMNDDVEPIVAYNLFQNGVCIQNTLKSNSDYTVKFEKYNLLGNSNEEVTVKFTVNIKI